MAVQSKTKTNLITASIIIFFSILSLIALMPFVFLTLSSFKPGVEMIQNGLNLRLDFENFSLTNYGYLFTQREGVYLHWYKNSIIITALQTGGGLLLSSMVGYALAQIGRAHV